MEKIKRGDIWLVNLNPTKGSEQKGVRPCLIISNDLTNKLAPTLCVLPITSKLAGKRFPINVVIKKKESGLKVDALVLCGQIRTVTKERLIKRLSSLDPKQMFKIEVALKIYLNMNK